MIPARRPETEWRWPPAVALLIALALDGALPSDVPVLLRAVVVVAGIVLLLPVVVLNPRWLTRETR